MEYSTLAPQWHLLPRFEEFREREASARQEAIIERMFADEERSRAAEASQLHLHEVASRMDERRRSALLKAFDISDELLMSFPANLRDQIIEFDLAEANLRTDPDKLEFKVEWGASIGDTRAAINWAQTEGQISAEVAAMLRHELLGYE